MPAMVEAVPIVMQVPKRAGDAALHLPPVRLGDAAGLASPPSTSRRRCRSRARWPRQLPRSIGPAGRNIAGRFMLIAPISVPGVVLSHPPSSTAPSTGCERRSSSRLQRQQVAVEHGRRLDEVLGERERRQLDRKAARLPDAALHFLGTRAEMRVAGIDVRPGIDDADHRLADEVVVVVAHLQRTRAMPERAQVGRAEPAVAAEGLGRLAGHGSVSGILSVCSQDFGRCYMPLILRKKRCDFASRLEGEGSPAATLMSSRALVLRARAGDGRS